MGNDPILLLSQSNVQTTTLLTPLIGTAGRNRTSIFSFVARGIFHYTTAVNLAEELGIEPRIAESKSAVIPFNYSSTTWRLQGVTIPFLMRDRHVCVHEHFEAIITGRSGRNRTDVHRLI